MAKRWKIRPFDGSTVQQIARQYSVPPLVAQILSSREITHPTQLDAFFDTRLTSLHPPLALPGMAQAVTAIYKASTSGRQIAIYGDYDCDGMTATAILYKCLKHLGANVRYFIPNRFDDGYGLNGDQIRRLKETGVELIITVDCGVASVAEAQLTAELGIDLVITDHHTPGPELPKALAIVHPGLPGSDYPFAGLCGAGVAFKLAWALFQHHSESEKLPEPMRQILFQAVGLAAIGTVADVVPLVGENRIIVHHGLKLLRAASILGVNFLMNFSKISPRGTLSAEDIGFGIAPRLNAAGRLGQAQLGVELLVCDSPTRAEALAEYIDNLNKSRESIERNMVREANKLLQSEFDPLQEPALVLANPDWHQGVIGIVAGRLAERYGLPTVIIRNDPFSDQPAVGSARSAGGINLYDALSACQQHLVGFGGHAAAAGLRIDCNSIDRFREEFCEQVQLMTSGMDRTPELLLDAEVAICELNLGVVRSIESMAPFGNGNHRPLLCVNAAELKGDAQKMGADGRHLALNIKQGDVSIRCVAFGQADWLADLKNGELYDFACKPVVNEFRGLNRVELQLVDFRPTHLRSAVAS